MSGYTTENKFVIAEGDEGDLYIFLQAKKEHPDEPRVIYDGYDHAIFMRRPEELIFWIISILKCVINCVRLVGL